MPGLHGPFRLWAILAAGSMLGLAGCDEVKPQNKAAPTETDVSAESDAALIEAAAEDVAASGPGHDIYVARCAACHDNPEQARAPSFSALQSMGSAQIRFALTSGKMQAQAAGLERAELAALMTYLSPGGEEGYVVPADASCEDKSISFETTYVERWGVELDNARYYSPQKTSLTKENVGDLELAWVFGLPGASDARSHPVITEDTMFVGASSGHAFALDRETGCVKWHNDLKVPLRSGLSLGEVGGKPAILFQDATTKVHALDGATGEILWAKSAAVVPESMGTGTPIQVGDRIIVPLSSNDVGLSGNPQHECCTGHGAVAAISAEDGSPIWAAHMTEPAQKTTLSEVGTQLWGPSGVPIWTTPTLDPANNRVYVGTGENTSVPATDTSDSIIAMDLDTGDFLWVYQATENDTWNLACSNWGKDGPNCPQPKGPDFDFGGSITLTRMADGRDVLVGGQKSGVVHVVDAASGELIWKKKVSAGSALGGIHWGLTVANGTVFVPGADPPFPYPGYEPNPGMTALDLETGDIKWEHKAERGCETDMAAMRAATSPWPECSFHFAYSAAPSSSDGLVFAGRLDGLMTIFDADTGEILWSYDTVQEFDAVNGVSTHGGAIDNAGPILAGDMLYVPSGYSTFNEMPGNAIIAFKPASAE